MNTVSSLTFHMYIQGCLTQKLGHIWDFWMYILGGTHPVATHEVMVESAQNQRHSLLSWPCWGDPVTWLIAPVAHTFTLLPPVMITTGTSCQPIVTLD